MRKIGIACKISDQLASTRMRLLIPSRHMKEYQYDLGDGDITIMPKSYVLLEDAVQLRGIKLWDVCDDHFDNPKLMDYYRAMLRIADVITCSTEVLRHRIKTISGREAHVISDPVQLPRKEPKVGGVTKILWHGHHTNLSALNNMNLRDYELAIVTNIDADWCIKWSLESLERALEWCDVVILPLKKDGWPAWDAKSPNRMTDAINAGRYVVANDMPSYQGFGMYLGDIAEGLKWLKSHQEQALEDLKKAQRIVTELHSPQTIANQWQSLFGSILDAAPNYGKDSSIVTCLETGAEAGRMLSAI